MRIAGLIAVGCLSLIRCATAADVDVPKLADDRLTLTLFAETPDIVTPIGMAREFIRSRLELSRLRGRERDA